MCRLNCINELRDVVSVGVQGIREVRYINRVNCMDIQTKLSKVLEELAGRDVRVERVRFLQFFVLRLADNFHDEVGTLRVSRLIEGAVIAFGLMFLFHRIYFRLRRIFVDRGVI